METNSYGTQGKKLQIVMEPKEKATDSYGTQGKKPQIVMEPKEKSYR